MSVFNLSIKYPLNYIQIKKSFNFYREKLKNQRILAASNTKALEKIKGLQGFLLLTRNEKFNDNEIELARHLSVSYGHAYNSFLTDFVIKDFFKKYLTGEKSWKVILVIIFILIIPSWSYLLSFLWFLDVRAT